MNPTSVLPYRRNRAGRFLLILLACVSILSCKRHIGYQQFPPGKIQVILDSAVFVRAGLTGFHPSSALISLRDSSGNLAAENLQTILFRNGATWYSLPVELPPGTYRLTRCVLTPAADSSGGEERALVILPDKNPVLLHTRQVLSVYPGKSRSDALYIIPLNHAVPNLKRVKTRIFARFDDPLMDSAYYVPVPLQLNSGSGKVSLFFSSGLHPVQMLMVNRADSLFTISLTDPVYDSVKTIVPLSRLAASFTSPLILSAYPRKHEHKTRLARFSFDGNLDPETGSKLVPVNHGTSYYKDRFGRQNSALWLDGSGFLSYGDILNEVRIPATVSVWVRLFKSPPDRIGILFHTDYQMPQFRWEGISLSVQNEILVAGYGDGNGLGRQYRRSASTVSRLPVFEWFHLTVVLKADNRHQIYLNGMPAEVAYSGTGSRLSHSSLPLIIGYNLKGQIDDLEFYNFALSPEAVESLYRSGKTAH